MDGSNLRKRLSRLFLIVATALILSLVFIVIYEEHLFEKRTASYHIKKDKAIIALLIKAQIDKLKRLTKEISCSKGAYEFVAESKTPPCFSKEKLKQLGIDYILFYKDGSFLKGAALQNGILTKNPLTFTPNKEQSGFIGLKKGIYIYSCFAIRKHCEGKPIGFVVTLERFSSAGFSAFGVITKPPKVTVHTNIPFVILENNRKTVLVFLDIFDRPLLALRIKPYLKAVFSAHDRMIFHVFILTVIGIVVSSIAIYLLTKNTTIDNIESIIKSLREIRYDMTFHPPAFKCREFNELANTIKWLLERLKESEYVFRKTADLIPVAIVVYKDKPIYANKEAKKVFGDDILEKMVIELTDPKYRDHMKIIKKRRISEGEFFTTTCIIRLNTTKRTILRVISTTIRYSGETAGLAIFIDITESQRLREFYRVVSAVNDVIIKFSSDEEIELVENVCNILSSIDEISFVWISKDGRILKSWGEKPEHLSSPMPLFDEISYINSSNDSSLAHLPVTVNGKREYVIHLYSDIPGLFTKSIIMLLSQLRINLSITLEKLRHKKARNYLIFYDSLTGLKNLNGLKKDLKGLTECTLFYLNVRNFTIINQIYGYNFADRLLVSIGTMLKDMFSNKATVYRLHSDKFAILIRKELDKRKAKLMAEEIIELLKNYEFEDREITLTIDIGITSVPSLVDNISELIESAEAALAEAKINKTISFYSRSMKEIAIQNLEIERYLKKAINDELFTFCYQPILNLRYNRIDKAEALIRLTDEKGRNINPERFIQIAEQSSLITDITRIAIKQTLKETAPLELGISINLSAKDIENEDIVEFLEKMLIAYRGKKRKVSIELTERDVMNSLEATKRMINDLKKLGVEVEIDDFGIGYSTLDRIVELDFDILKIDKSLISLIDKNPKANQIISYIVKLSHSLNTKAQAEGVETKNQLDFLRSVGCDYIQGYLISKPLPLDKLKEFIKRNKFSI